MSCDNLDPDIKICTLKMKNMLNAAVMTTILKSMKIEGGEATFSRMCPMAGCVTAKFDKCPWRNMDSMEKGL